MKEIIKSKTKISDIEIKKAIQKVNESRKLI